MSNPLQTRTFKAPTGIEPVKRSDRRDRALKLRAKDLSYEAIAKELGISRTTAYRWLNPAYEAAQRRLSLAWKERNREFNRARDREYRAHQRAICSECDGDCGIGSACRPGPHRCADCIAAAAEQRADRIAELYNAGIPLKAIAADLGTTRGAISQDVIALRRQGRIGYRYAACAERAAV